MRICTQCNKKHNRNTKLCNRCYTNKPDQIEKRRDRDRRYYKKLSEKWKNERSSLICKRCGIKFKSKRRGTKYCSLECQLNLKTKNKRGEINCIICNKNFFQKRRDSKCCSKKCIKKWEYINRDKERKRFYEKTRYWRKKSNGGNFSSQEWEEIKIKYKHTCNICSRMEPNIKLTIDHIIPISKGGRHEKGNIQPLCLKCNLVKNNKL